MWIGENNDFLEVRRVIWSNVWTDVWQTGLLLMYLVSSGFSFQDNLILILIDPV